MSNQENKKSKALKKGKKKAHVERVDRSAKALRENLIRRKVQSRGRDGQKCHLSNNLGNIRIGSGDEV